MLRSRVARAGKRREYLTAVAVASVIVVVLLVVRLVPFGPASSGTGVETIATISTSYGVIASSVVALAASHAPSDYSLGSSKQLNPKETGLVSGAYGIFSTPDGYSANMTILVFNGTGSAQTYIESVISNYKNLGGYSDATGALAGFEQYGVCYGFGETDPDGNGAVANGVCEKGNVYIQVHVVAPSTLSAAENDLSGLVGAAYQVID